MQNDESVLGLSIIRRNRGITLEQIAAQTKISVRWLDAIERGDFGTLPGGIYNTNYIKQYARAIDYDEEVILGAYQRATAPVGAPVAARKGLMGSLRTVSGIAS